MSNTASWASLRHLIRFKGKRDKSDRPTSKTDVKKINVSK